MEKLEVIFDSLWQKMDFFLLGSQRNLGTGVPWTGKKDYDTISAGEGQSQ